MRKLTRRAYNRKVLVFGISIFMSIAMISTGFAAWVLSSVTGVEDAKSPVKVAVVTDNSITIKVTQWDGSKWNGDTLSFDAEADDHTGRVQADPEAKEVLTLPINIEITGAGTLSSATMRVDLPEKIARAMQSNPNYLTLKKIGGYEVGTIAFETKGETSAYPRVQASTVGTDGKIATLTLYENLKKVGEEEQVVFSFIVPLAKEGTAFKTSQSMALEFGWGSFFGNLNPCEFYDSTTAKRDGTAGADIDAATVSTEMEAFETAMGITAAETEEAAKDYVIYITITGTAA